MKLDPFELYPGMDLRSPAKRTVRMNKVLAILKSHIDSCHLENYEGILSSDAMIAVVSYIRTIEGEIKKLDN